MNPVLVDLGVITIYWYSALVFLGLLVGGTLVLKEAKKMKMGEENMMNLILWLIVFGIIGARLYYVIFNFGYYSNNFLEIFKIWEGGLAIHGVVIAGIIVTLLYTRKHRMNTLKTMDILVVGSIIGQAIGRWGNFFNGEAHGGIVELETLQSFFIPNFIIEGMKFGPHYYHPTFLYESLWCLLGLVILLIVRRRKFVKNGQLLAIYLFWYGLGRMFIETLRTDSLMIGNLRVAIIVSIIMMICGIFIFIKQMKGSKLENLYNEVKK